MTTLPYVAIELIPDPELGGFTARIPDIPAYGEGPTEEEAIADLKVGIQAYIEENGRRWSVFFSGKDLSCGVSSAAIMS